VFLPESWPWCKGQPAILSVAESGIAKVQYMVYNIRLPHIMAVTALLKSVVKLADASYPLSGSTH
jgi:hypothetical protein